MPVVFIEAPPGIRSEAKKKMVAKITAAIDEAYHIGDTLDLPARVSGGKCGDRWLPPVGKSQSSGSPEENQCWNLVYFTVPRIENRFALN